MPSSSDDSTSRGADGGTDRTAGGTPGGRAPTHRRPTRILVKLRSSSALGVAESRGRLEPLHEDAPAGPARFGVEGEARWFLAELPDGAGDLALAEGGTGGEGRGWDLAHARVADQLGIAPQDLLFAEPDLAYADFEGGGTGEPGNERDPDTPFALGEKCDGPMPQESGGGRARGPDTFAWHLDDAYTQLARARDAVTFRGRRTRIAHLDTGYWPDHVSTPRHLLADLARNFAEEEEDGGVDPGRRVRLMDNSGHGTGTLGILAGQRGPADADAPDRDPGGAPEAEVVPLRIAPRVVLLRASAFARALQYALDIECDVASMSMGGLPSRAWRETVDRAYLAGMCMVTAAGNNYAGLPTRNLVYPARYGRVIAACGVMADGRPYARLQGRTMEGNHGPESQMGAAMSAYTPNIPWAVMGCRDRFRLNGAGTSSATPQIAAAAALWFEKNKSALPRDWRRVEALRQALFATAAQPDGYSRRVYGRGVLRAHDALQRLPMLGLPQTPSDRDSFAFLRVLTGLGIDAPTPREAMFDLEVLQRWTLNPRLQELVPDPEATPSLDEKTLREVMEALIEDEGASHTLRRHLQGRWASVTGRDRSSVPELPRAEGVKAPAEGPLFDPQPEIPDPPCRRLQVFAVDPSFAGSFERAGMSETTLSVRWEPLKRGPIGEYLAVRDTGGGGSGAHRRSSVDLNDPRLLATDGWAPSEGNHHFHQQMVYAVAMKTIEHFEEALGRPVLWRGKEEGDPDAPAPAWTPHLTIRPHAFEQANAFYSPDEVSLLFGYFDAPADDPSVSMPGGRVYTCLSHDIIAHETTHAILDGMQRNFHHPTNPDVLAFHEALADIVALLQHFTLPGILEEEIARTRGELDAAETWLGSLAVQFGHATGRGGGLREAIGRFEDGVWVRHTPDPRELARLHTPHARGAVLVAAVFDAFLAIYRSRSADLYRLATGGTGVLAEGAIHPDLVGRLAREARKAATHVLRMCIRALDYLPPVDVTFFEYLRALITADMEAMPDDPHHHRVAFAEAFRRRGIYPQDLDRPGADTARTLSVSTLRWRGIEGNFLVTAKPGDLEARYDEILAELKVFTDACFYLRDREALFLATASHKGRIHTHLKKVFRSFPPFAEEVGLDPDHPFQVEELRRSLRVTPGGRHVPQVVLALTQAVEVAADPEKGLPAHTFRGGSTLVVDLSEPAVRFRIVKRMGSTRRRARTAAFHAAAARDPLRALHLAQGGHEPFAALHALGGEEG